MAMFESLEIIKDTIIQLSLKSRTEGYKKDTILQVENQLFQVENERSSFHNNLRILESLQEENEFVIQSFSYMERELSTEVYILAAELLNIQGGDVDTTTFTKLSNKL